MFEIFQYQFMINAVFAGVVIAVIASVSGSFMVLRRYSLMTETLAHSALVGVAIGIISGLSPMWMAVAVALISAWSIEYLRSFYHLYSDAILAVFLSASLALAIVIVSLAGAFNSSLFSYLFGSILSVGSDDVFIIVGFGLIAMSLIAYFYKELYFIAFDEEVAQVSGIPVKSLNFMMVSIVAVIIALSIQIVGTLLIGALMVMPTVAALRFRQGFAKTILLAVAFAVFSVLAGMLLSFYLSLPSGATIVLCVLSIFIISLVANRR
jgi:zinc transport system permease protein